MNALVESLLIIVYAVGIGLFFGALLFPLYALMYHPKVRNPLAPIADLFGRWMEYWVDKSLEWEEE